MTTPVPPDYIELEGSQRTAAGAARVGDADPGESVLVTITVRRRPDAPALPDLSALSRRRSRPPAVSREDFAVRYGADPADLKRVAQFATSHGLTVVESSVAKRSVQVSGTVAQMEQAFSVDLGRYTRPREDRHKRAGRAAPDVEEYRGREGAIYIPAELKDVVLGVFGLDNRRMARSAVRKSVSPAQDVSPTTPQQVAQLYDFPVTSAAGETIGLLEFGGGYQEADVESYFKNQGLAVPNLVAVLVDGQTNDYGGPDDLYSVEVNLDISVAGAVAQGGDIAVYFAPWSEEGWVDVISTAVHDTTNKPSVLSISYGWPEKFDFAGDAWTPNAITAVDGWFQDAAMLGVTVFASSGDNGSSCGVVPPPTAKVQYPASDPYVTSCGGTTLNINGSTFTETTWNDNGVTGGGVSDVFPLPDYQDFADVSKSVNDGHVGRGVPDIGGNADPDSGYDLYVGGGYIGSWGGTSAVAPLYAGLTARMNAILGEPVGFLQPNLYAFENAAVYRNIPGGTNATDGAPGYPSTPGYDCCTGLGSVDGNALLNKIRGLGRPPALTVFKNQLFMAWKGMEGDDRQWYSTFTTSWAPQKQIPGVWSSVGPSLAVYDNKIFMAWKGMHFANVGIDDQSLWWTTFNGTTWAPQQKAPEGWSSMGPSLAVFDGKLYMVWKGMLDDETMWWSTYDGSSWAPQQQIPGVWSSVGPSVAVFKGKLYMAWKGAAGDQGIWWTTYNGSSWAPQQNVSGVATSDMPSLAVYDGQLYMAWKGEAGDQRLWYTTFNGTKWASQQEIPGVWSSVGPELCPFQNDLYMTWKGESGDQRIWYTSFNCTKWAAQQVVPGVGTSPDLLA